MYPPQDLGRPEFLAELEAEIVANYQRLYTPRRKNTAWWSPRYPIVRYAMGALLLIAVLGVACELPTSSQVEMGQHARVWFVADEAELDNGAFDMRLREALAAAGAEKVHIALLQNDGAPTELQVFAWGQHVSQDDIEAVILQHVGQTNLRTIDFESLAGTVSETLGRKIGRRLFGIDVSGETAEQLRATILEQLAAQGFDGTARVEVLDDGTRRKVTVEASTADGSRETISEIIIENPDN